MTGCPLNEIEMNMKTALRVSIWLNLGLLGGLFFILLDWRKPATVPGPALSDAGPPVAKAAIAPATPPPAAAPEPFHWSQLEAPNSYQTYIANLRAIGCPEPTIEDIVRGDAARTFSWERSQLGLDGSGAGPWSRSRELQLVASLLGGHADHDVAQTGKEGNAGRRANHRRKVRRIAREVASVAFTKSKDRTAGLPVVSSESGLEGLGLQCRTSRRRLPRYASNSRARSAV